MKVMEIQGSLRNSLPSGKVTDQEIEKAAEAVAALPSKTYNLAVVFLGLVTVILAAGAIYLGDGVNEALWGALGAGIGGLAGIFMARD